MLPFPKRIFIKKKEGRVPPLPLACKRSEIIERIERNDPEYSGANTVFFNLCYSHPDQPRC